MTPETAPSPRSAEDMESRALNEALRGSLRILKALMALVTAIVIFSGVFTVEPNEVAIVLRFGQPAAASVSQLLGPGLHWAFPYPIDEIIRVPAGQSHTVTSTIGWQSLTPEQMARGESPAPRGALSPGVDGYLLAGDGNIFHARATLKYRIADPWQYAFTFASASNVLQSLLDNALLHAASTVTADSAIYRDKLAFRDAVLAEIDRGLQAHPLGIALDPFEAQTAAPADVRGAFEAVLAAEQERSQKINEARGLASETVLKAAGQAQAALSEGAAASNKLVLAVASQAKFFAEQLPHYRAAPRLFQRRLLAESMESILAGAQDVFLLPQASGPGRQQVRVQLNRSPVKEKTNTVSTP